jgi:hypothetical protein
MCLIFIDTASICSSRVMASHVELHTTEQEINHPNCLSLPGFTGPNVCHARERTKQIVRLNVIPKGATRDAAGD